MTITKNDKKHFICSGAIFILFVIFTVLVKFIDVKPIGPEGSMVGFATVNQAVHNFFGINNFWYELTQIFGYVAILVMLVFAIVGLFQLVWRKKIALVDKNIITLGCFYILVICFYVIFEKVVINYRPIIVDVKEGLEASYPSTHTLLILCVFGSLIRELKFYIKSAVTLKILQAACWLVIVLTVVGRLICGVHWFTDIIGGIALSCSLLVLPRAEK